MADMVTVQELENAKIDARTIGESVNENKIVTPRYGTPFKSMPMIAEEMQSIIGTIIAGGVPASIVLDGNQAQDEINLYGGKKYDMPAGGYLVGGLVRLDNGDIVKSTVANNTVDPNVDMTGWVNPESILKSVLEYGARSNANNSQSFDSTAAFQNALDFEWVTYPSADSLAYYPKAKNKRVRVPLGRYLITDTLPISSYLNLDFDDGVVIDFKPTTLKDLFSPPISKMTTAYDSGATTWKDMTIYGLRFTGAALFKGDLTRSGTVNANCAVRGSNVHRALFSRFAVEGFKEGLRIDRLDTSTWTGTRIGNFYENVVDNVSIQDCTLPFYNSGNLTTVINGRIGHELLQKTDINMGDYLVHNTGAGFTSLNLNIASLSRSNNPKLGHIYDNCQGSTYHGLYSEYFDNLFVVNPALRFGGLKVDVGHVVKYPTDVLLKFVDGYMPSYNPATNTRSGTNLKSAANWTELNTGGIQFFNSQAELLDDFFVFAPQYDFKYGLYGAYFPAIQQIAVDFKRFGTRNDGFLSKNGARFIATQATTLRFPVKQNQYDAYICILAKVITGNFAGADIKLNVDSIGNEFITTAETFYDYGNGWKMYAVRDASLDPRKATNLEISIKNGVQVEIEHIGAYKNGVPIYPNFKDVMPKINSNTFMYCGNSDVASSYLKVSGGQLGIGDALAPFIQVVGGAVNQERNISYTFVETEGTNRQNTLDGNHTGFYGNANITFSDANTFDSAVTATGNSRNFAESIGIGQYIGITQDAILTADAKVIDRVYSVPESKYTTNLILNKNFNVAVAIASHSAAQKPIYKTVKGADVAKTLTGSKTFDPPSLAANAIQSTTVTVSGALVGDTVDVGFSVALGVSSRMWGEVTASNTVTVYHQNLTASVVDVLSGTLITKVIQ